MTQLDDSTVALIRLAAAVARGREPLIRERCKAVMAAGVPPLWVDELMLQCMLMAGYPRALSALAIWRETSGVPAESLEDGTDLSQYPTWQARGEETCRVVYGANYDKLRANVRQLHPALDAWMVAEGYGRTLGRPGLDLARRELSVVAVCVALGAERQLHSHLKGSLNAGVDPATLEAALEIVLPDADPAAAAMTRRLWSAIRS
jgi:4-carboxymuconolactone decarboxylase